MELEKLQKRSKQGAYISFVGFIFIALGFTFASWKLSELNNDIEAKTKIKSQLNDTLKLKETEIEEKNRVISELVKELNAFKEPKVTPKATAEKLGNVKDPTGRQVYDFNIWITATQFTLDKIEKVNYHFSHESFIKKARSSSERSNGFSVNYRGWGCIPLKIDVYYKNGKMESLFFDMCRALD